MPRIADALVKRNNAGGPTYALSDRAKVLRALFLGGVGPTFYASANKLDGQASRYFARAAREDAVWFADAILAARQKGLMRTSPIRALAYLSMGDLEAKAHFVRLFPSVIQTPGDLQEFVAYLRGNAKIRGLSGVTQRAVRQWLGGMSTYHAIKYGSEKQGFALRDIYRLSRGRYTGASQAIAHYLVKNEVKEPELIPQIAGYEAFKHLVQQGNFSDALQTVQEHRLPWEVVAPQFPLGKMDRTRMAEVWMTMSRQMPYMALLRNLRNLLASGALDNPEVLRDVTYKLTRAENVLNSKQYPFRFYTAFKMMERTREGTPDQRAALRAALMEALGISVQNTPSLGRVAILNDVSGSMYSSYNGRGGDDEITFADLGSLFSASLALKNVGSTIVSFSNNLYVRTYSAQDTIVSLMRACAESDQGGTSIWKALHYVAGGRIGLKDAVSSGWSGWSSYRDQQVRETVTPEVYDTFVILTDSQSWDGEWSHTTNGSTTRDIIAQYIERVNPKAQFIFIQLAQNEAQIVPEDMPNCHFVSGWSNMVFDFLSFVHEGLDNLTDGVVA